MVIQNKNIISFYRYTRIIGTVASFLMFLFAIGAVFPLTNKTSEDVEAVGTPVVSETTLAMVVDHSSANLDIAP